MYFFYVIEGIYI